MHIVTQNWMVILFPLRFYLNTEGFPRTGEYKKAVVEWAVGVWIVEIRKLGRAHQHYTGIAVVR